MNPDLPRSPLVLVGPTAAGKTALSVEIARRCGAEIVSVDSMQLYRGMDIGTATPTIAERQGVVHHLLDLLDPHEEATVGWFQRRATSVLEDLERRGVPTILVGGSGLYHRCVMDRLEIPGRYPDVADSLAAEGAGSAELHGRLRVLDPLAASRIEPTNLRRVLRALEVTIGSRRAFSSFGPGLESYPPNPMLLVGLRVPRGEMLGRVAARFEAQLAAGFLDEVRRIEASSQGWSRTSEQALGYRELLAHLRHGRSLDDCVAEAIRRTRRFAVRQERWFVRDPRITWLDAPPPGDPDDLAALCDVVTDMWDSSVDATGVSPVVGRR